MSAPLYSDADFLFGLQSLLPTGAVWPREPDAVQTQTLLPLVKEYTRNTARAANLLEDAFPVAPIELLPEWQQTLGLPDPCAGPAPSLQVAQQQVAARFIAGGGQSVAYFISVAAALGYPITITQYAPFRFGQSFGQPMNGPAFAFAWQVNAPTYTIDTFKFGRDNFGEPFATWQTSVLQCELGRLAPAHTILTFNYTPSAGLFSSGGVICLVNPLAYPVSSGGLPAGALWSNGGVVSVIPGVTPNPAAPPVYLLTTTAAALLTLGGGNLPTTSPPVGSGILWNEQGEVWVA